MALQYRPEVDGLRALAVVPIILFHAGFTLFSGGFIGVDVFFVISGYLITNNIVRDLKAGSFSFANFYKRRARRILPALFLVMLCCLPFARMWMLPLELRDFAFSAMSVIAFGSNIFFWRQSGYFETSSELKPLLHTWSLGVEEQFYILFPFILFLTWRFGRKASVLLIAAVAGISFLFCEYASRLYPSFNFYWLIPRAWELIAGSLCAFATFVPDRKRDDVLAAFGLILIVISIFIFDNSVRFPSIYALLPVGGACLIILFAQRETITARLLSLRLISGVGIISYSAYLWHQPLFAFIRIRSSVEPSTGLMAVMALFVFPLAWLTWRYIETPFRTSGSANGFSRKKLAPALVAIPAALSCLTLVSHLTLGSISNLTEEDSLLVASTSPSPLRKTCHYSQERQIPVGDSCVYFDGNPSVAIYGNSHGVEVAYAVAKSLKDRKQAIIHFTVSGCPVIFNQKSGVYCQNFYTDRLNYILQNEAIHTVVLSFRIENDGSAAAASLVDLANFLSSSGKKVILVLQAPTLSHDVSIDIRTAISKKSSTVAGRTRSEWTLISSSIYTNSRRLDKAVKVLDPADTFCADTMCHSILDGKAMYFDNNHMSLAGAEMLARKIIPLLD